MKRLRPSKERGHADHGWLRSKHSFSFAGYRDPRHMGFGPLRVINEDRVAPGRGFDTHPHENMEIISYVIEGALEHRDSTGQVSVIRRSDVQHMSAGTGVFHSEYNASKTDPAHFLQIWILPGERDVAPGYGQRRFDDLEGGLRLVASGDGRDGSLRINAGVDLYAGKLAGGGKAAMDVGAGRGIWIQMVKGRVVADGQPLGEGDGLAVAEVPEVGVSAEEESELLLFDLPL